MRCSIFLRRLRFRSSGTGKHALTVRLSGLFVRLFNWAGQALTIWRRLVGRSLRARLVRVSNAWTKRKLPGPGPPITVRLVHRPSNLWF